MKMIGRMKVMAMLRQGFEKQRMQTDEKMSGFRLLR